MLIRGSFDHGFKKLEWAFGAKENKQRAEIYFDHLQEVLDDFKWSRIVNRLIQASSAFPKLSEILAMHECRSPEKRREGTLQAWVEDVCRLKGCVDGHILMEGRTYNALYRCPECNRLDIPALPEFPHPVERKTDEELRIEKDLRAQVAFNLEFRREIGTDLVRTLYAMFDRPEADRGKPGQAMEGVGLQGGGG